MLYETPRHTKVPWDAIEDAADLMRAGTYITRDCRHETHIGLLVRQTYQPAQPLGLVAIRCQRGGPYGLIPLGVALTDPEGELDTTIPAQSSARRMRFWVDDEDWR